MNHKFIAALNRSFRGYFLFLAVLSLVFGTAIYIFLRTSGFVFFRWIETLGMAEAIDLARMKLLDANAQLPGWIIFSLPSALWAFSSTLVIMSIWSRNPSRIRYFWMAGIPILVFGFEGLQFLGILPGTFCTQDLLLSAAGILLGVCVVRIISRISSHEKATES